MLTDEQRERYSRHLMLEQIAEEGQQRLLESRVLIIGAGGLGSPIAIYLAAAGIGTIGIADSDRVELSNLQRQIAHRMADLGRLKVESAQEKLLGINPEIRINVYPERVDAGNIGKIMNGYDFVIDGSDNFPTKFLINDACIIGVKPYSHGGILKFNGQTFTIIPGVSACYRCIFPEAPEGELAVACSRAGVLGVLPGIIGTLQATEAIKYLLGKGDLLSNRLLTYDALRMKFREVPLKRNSLCPVCGNSPTINLIPPSNA